jgi:glycosyltransferase involved in cell wall biosynthesis
MGTPEVSVVIPAYNAEKYIAKCLASLDKQTFKDFEVVVVDDGSTDSTCDIAQKYSVRLVRNPQNLGEGASRNRGAEVAQGKILVHTDSDIIAPEGWLEKIVSTLKDGDVKAVASGYCGSVGNSFMELFAHLELAFRRKNFRGFVNTAVSNNFASYRDVFFDAGGFPEKYKCEDMRLSYRISRNHPILWDHENCVYHHFRPSLKSYLKQQYYFARDTVWTYYSYPKMLLRKTHQGRGIYLETALTLFAFVSAFMFPLAAIPLLALILLLNISFLKFIKGQIPQLQSYLVVLARDMICVFGVFAGAAMCLGDIAMRILGKAENKRGTTE